MHTRTSGSLKPYLISCSKSQVQARYQVITSRVWTVCTVPFSRHSLHNYHSQQPKYVATSGARNVVTYFTLFAPVESHTTETSYYATPLLILSSFPTLLPFVLPLFWWPFLSILLTSSLYLDCLLLLLFPFLPLSALCPFLFPSFRSFSSLFILLFISYVSPPIYPRHFKTLTPYSQTVIVIGLKYFCKYLNYR